MILGIFGGSKEKKCQECIRRGYQILRDGTRYQMLSDKILAAYFQFRKVKELDPDNKTGLHV